MADFSDEIARMTREVDCVFGEDFAFQPYAPALDTTAPEAIDTTRAAATVRAIFADREGKPPTHSWDARQTHRPGVETGGIVLEVSLGQQQEFACAGTPLVIRVSDRFTRALTGATYRVASIEPVTPSGLMRLKVNEI